MNKTASHFILVFIFIFSFTTCNRYSDEELYSNAISNSVSVSESEIKNLVTLTKNDKNVIWNDDEKVLLMTFHRFPESYKAGSEITIKWESWLVSPLEFINRYEYFSKNTTDWTLRIKQILGMPEESKNTHITFLWCSSKDCYRPAYSTDATKNEMSLTLKKDLPEEYKTWFETNEKNSYKYDEEKSIWEGYPWTRLGYTYDWKYTKKTYGLSEFMLKKEAVVKVESTKTIPEFIDWAKKQAKIKGERSFHY